MIKDYIPIKNFKEGISVKGFFLCTEKHLRYTKSGDLFLDLELRDITGRISAKIWNNVELLDKKFESGNAIVVSGNVESFIGKLQLIIKKINKATVQYYSRYGFDPGLIVPKSKKNPKKMWNQIEILINGIKNKHNQILLRSIFKENKKQIMYFPASVNTYYNFRSGFLEHLVGVGKLAKKISVLYNVDQDLVLTGSLLYNIGVLRGINSNFEFDYTKVGKLIGNCILGRDLVIKYAKKIKNFPEKILIKLDHIILSVNNSKDLEKSSLSSFPEAILVKMIVLIDIKMSIMEGLINEDQDSGDFTSKYNYFGIPIMKND